MRKSLAVASVSISMMLGALLLSGCGMEKVGDVGNKNIRKNSVRYDANGNEWVDRRFADDQRNEMNQFSGKSLNNNNVIGLHRNYRLEMSEKMADRISELNPVMSSYVMLTDQNAYVAVSLGTKKYERNGKMMNRLDRNGIRMKETAEEDVSTGAIGEQLLTTELKNRIANLVKENKPTIDQVYVSASPEFIERLSGYMMEAKQGHPIQGFLAEFNATVDRLFPVESGTDSITKGYRNSGKQIQP